MRGDDKEYDGPNVVNFASCVASAQKKATVQRQKKLAFKFVAEGKKALSLKQLLTRSFKTG